MRHAKEIFLMILAALFGLVACAPLVFGGQPAKATVAAPQYVAGAYYLVGTGATAQAVAIVTQPLTERIAALEARIAALEKQINGEQPAAAGPAPQAPAEPAAPSVPDTWKPAEVVQRNCVSCHSGASAKGGVDYSTEAEYEKHIAAGVIEASRNRMPPNKPLSDADVELLTAAYEATK